MSTQCILVVLFVLALSCVRVRGSDSEQQLNLAINQLERNQECFDIFDKIRLIAARRALLFVSDSEMDTLCNGVCGDIGRRIIRYDNLARDSASVCMFVYLILNLYAIISIVGMVGIAKIYVVVVTFCFFSYRYCQYLYNNTGNYTHL